MLAFADDVMALERPRAERRSGAPPAGPPIARRAPVKAGGRVLKIAIRTVNVLVVLLMAALLFSRDVLGWLPDEHLFRAIATVILISWAGLVLADLLRRGFRLPRRRQADDLLGLLDVLPGARESLPSVLYVLAVPTAIAFGALTLALIGEERFLDSPALAIGGFVGGASISLVLYYLALKAWVQRRGARRIRSQVRGGRRG